MPAYDYHCETNGRTVEVSHTMTTLLQTWGQLCDTAESGSGRNPGRCTAAARVFGAPDRRQGARFGCAAGAQRALPAERLPVLQLTRCN